MNIAEGSVVSVHELREHHEVQICKEESDGSWTTMATTPVLGLAVVRDSGDGTYVEPLVISAEGDPAPIGVVMGTAFLGTGYQWFLAYKGKRLELKAYERPRISNPRKGA